VTAGRATRAGAALAAALALTLPAWAGPSPPVPHDPDPPVLRQADVPLLERVYEDSGAARRVERKSWTAYLGYLGARVGAAIDRLLMGGFERLSGLSLLWSWAARLIVAGAVLALIFVLVRLAAHLWRRSRRAVEAGAGDGELTARAPGRDAAAWRAEFERRLAAGEVARALEAAWWWLASSLSGEEVDPSWTGRELLERAGRRELLPVVRRFDVLAYGPLRPAAEEVRRYGAQLAEVLG